MHVDRGGYKTIDVLLVILIDIILLLALLSASLITFYEKWQLDIADKFSSVMPMHTPPVIGFIMAAPIVTMIAIVTSGKNVYFKIIGSACAIAILKWYIKISIPSARLEKTLLSPLKEQCYTLLETIPLIAGCLCILLGLLNFVFRDNMELDLVESRNNMYVFYGMLFVCVFIIPYVLRPLITIWL